jgi:hypothetical protein
MSLWTAIVIIVAIGAYLKIRQERYREWHREGDRAPARELELEREVAELRDRVQVLERILTDERHSCGLADEIETLRDR